MDSIDNALGGLVAWVKLHPGTALAITIALHVLTILITTIWTNRITNLSTRHKRLFRGTTGNDLEAQVMRTIESAQESEARIESLSKAVQRIDSSFIQGFRKTGFTRYDAVPGQGGMQSFSIALLDDANSGLVLTVITGRAESRTYCKPVVNGISNMLLSDEEKLVIASATLPAQQGLASSSA